MVSHSVGHLNVLNQFLEVSTPLGRIRVPEIFAGSTFSRTFFLNQERRERGVFSGG